MQTCYLCGELISETDMNYDHVPARQFFPEEFRKNKSPQLLTLPTHKKCNSSFQKDEEYFFQSLFPLADGSPIGEQLWQEFYRKAEKHPRGYSLALKVYKEFKGHTPEGMVIKTMETERIENVLWKITRGLFFKEYGRILNGNLKCYLDHYYPNMGNPPPAYNLILSSPSKGLYSEYFDYKNMDDKNFPGFPELNLTKGHFYNWAFRFWSSIVYFIFFVDSDCRCESCDRILIKP
jgi:hypothetical protein